MCTCVSPNFTLSRDAWCKNRIHPPNIYPQVILVEELRLTQVCIQNYRKIKGVKMFSKLMTNGVFEHAGFSVGDYLRPTSIGLSYSKCNSNARSLYYA